MARHPVGGFEVEVLHHLDKPGQKPDLILIVFKDGQYVVSGPNCGVARFVNYKDSSRSLQP